MMIIKRSLDVHNTMERNSFFVPSMQAFYLVMSTIFIGVKGNDNSNLKISLFFMDGNDDVEC